MTDKNIYTLEDFTEYLAELPLGTEHVKKLTDYAELKQKQLEFTQSRLHVASQIIGADVITECMNE